MTVIVANSALMATAFYGQPPEMTLVVEAINYGFTCIYVLEFVLKVNMPVDCCLIQSGGIASLCSVRISAAQHLTQHSPYRDACKCHACFTLAEPSHV